MRCEDLTDTVLNLKRSNLQLKTPDFTAKNILVFLNLAIKRGVVFF